MKFLLFPVFAFLMLPSALPAQAFMRGLLVTTDGDSLDGLVCPLDKVVLFQYNRQESVKRFKFSQVVSFYANEQNWELHEAEVLKANFPERVKTFMKVLVEGPVRLLEYTGEDYYGGTHLNYLLQDEKGKLFRIDKSGFKRRMSEYFSEYADLSGKITTEELGYEQLPAIVVMFNIWLKEQQPSN